ESEGRAARFLSAWHLCSGPRAQLGWHFSRPKPIASGPRPHNSEFRVVDHPEISTQLELKVSGELEDCPLVSVVIALEFGLAGVFPPPESGGQSGRQDPL